MPMMKLRGLGQFGILSDVDPYDLPLQAFSAGVNIRFTGEHVDRAPIFRSAAVLATQSPRMVTSRFTISGEEVFVGYLNGTVAYVTPTTEANKSVAGYVPSDAEIVYTNTTLARVLYVNRTDRVPWAYTPAGSQFVTLANWDTTWRCKVLRSYNNALVALNMTKNGVDYPTMVNTSNFPTDGTVPTSWDYSTPGTDCYQNIISEMRGEVVDALGLSDSLFVYSQFQTFEMRATGDSELYKIEPRFLDRGALNTNCVIELDGFHFVFGLSDIYKHDGITPKSLIDEKVSKIIFGNLNRSKANLSFVNFDPNLKEVRFNYVSLDPLCAFPASVADGCNRCAAFNLVNGTWGFYDLPYIFAATVASFPKSRTWDQLSGVPWDTLGGSWNSMADPVRRGVLAVGPTVSAYSLTAKVYGHDAHSGGMYSFDVDTHATAPVYLERKGIDLDEVPPYFLRGNKLVRSIYPQARLAVDAVPLEFSFGFASGTNEELVWTAYQTFDGTADTYKLDFGESGRFLAMRMRHNDFRDFTLVGFDLDTTKLSER